ncbi:MAG TPA: methyltransferase domain-containing protein [Gemmatimonadaceae bacterium]|nr:methyltransferase domain-containing protein [Gemmatimonadaceae bacterium]
MSERRASIYDKDEYYADSARGARLSPMLEWAVRLLDRRRARAVVRATGLHSGKLLDVGAGDGKFMHYMQRLGFDARGTTASRRSATAAKAMFGLELDLTETLEQELPRGPFDLVTYWHVFEHLEQPSAHTVRWPELVRPGGFIVIEVPNLCSIGARLCRRSWLGSDLSYHVNQQDPAAMLDLVRDGGFEVIRVEQFSGKYSYAYLWSALLGRLFGRRYEFDEILGVLKTPSRSLKARPLWTVNALAAVGYLAPVILILMLYGCMTDRGEVLRIYARRRSP